MLVCFHLLAWCFLSVEDLEASKVARIADIKDVSLVALLDDLLVLLNFALFHGVNDDGEIFLGESFEHETIAQTLLNLVLHLLRLLNDFGNKFFFLVVPSEDLC